MFGEPGTLYVYRSYGIHWCVNIVVRARRDGVQRCCCERSSRRTGSLEMRARRGHSDDKALCSGPGKLTQALGISGADDGRLVDAAPFALQPPEQRPEAVATPRIGITKGVEMPWRYVVRGTRSWVRQLEPSR